MPSRAAALTGVCGVFLLPGYRDMPGLLTAIRAAGVKRMVLLSGASAAGGDTGNAISAYLIRSESAVRDSGLPWTIVRPSAFMSNALRWLPQLAAGDTVRAPFANVPTAAVDPYDMDASVVSVRASPDARPAASSSGRPRTPTRFDDRHVDGASKLTRPAERST